MAVAFDAVGPSSAGATRAASTSSPAAQTWSHTCTGTELFLVIMAAYGAQTNDGTASTPTVTYNGVAATQIGTRKHNNNGSNGFVELWGLVAPATGANTVSVSYPFTSDNISLSLGSVSFTGVDQTTPVAHTNTAAGASATPSCAVTSATDNMTVAVLGCGNSVNSATAGTSRWIRNTDGNSAGGNGAGSTGVGAASVTHTWSINDDWWGVIAADIAAAGAGGGGAVVGDGLTSGLKLNRLSFVRGSPRHAAEQRTFVGWRHGLVIPDCRPLIPNRKRAA